MSPNTARLGNLTLQTIISIALGAATLNYVGKIGNSMTPIVQECRKSLNVSWNFYKTGNNVLDTFLCFITPFFVNALSNPLGEVIMGVLGGLFIAFTLWSCIESQRPGAKLVTNLVAVTMFFVQTLGISVAVPALYIPSRWFSRNGDNPIRPDKVGKASLIFGIITATVVSMTLFPNHQSLTIALFNFGPIVFAFLLNLPLFGFPLNVKSVYTINGFILSLSYWSTLYQFFSRHSLSWSTPGVLTHETFPEFAVHFLLIDLIVLAISLLFLTLVETGSKESIKTLIMSIIFGPGPAFLFWASRNENVSKSK